MNFNFIKHLTALGVSTVLWSASLHASERPNILFIMSDDHASHAISAYGGIYQDIAPTPNIDRLAKEGMLMENVFCTNAICGPSRACILTGKYSHKNGFYKNRQGGVFNVDQWTFPEALQKEGYRTALVGKWHLGSKPRGFDYFKYHVGVWQQGSYWDPTYNENGTVVQEKGYATNITTDTALEWLEMVEGNDAPFCLLLQYKAPHRHWAPDEKYTTLWENVELPYPGTFFDDYAGREETAGNTEMTMDYFNRRDMKIPAPEGSDEDAVERWNTFGNKRGDTVLMKAGLDPAANRRAKYQRYIKDYLACIRSVDDNIGRVLDYLNAKGLSENTVVIYTSDQGFFLGDHGWFDKRFMYEESLRMPFVIRHPGVIQAGTRNHDIVTNIDFAPTLMDIAQVKIPQSVQGRSFKHVLRGETPVDWRQSMYYHYYEYPFWHHVQPHYGIRTERYKLIHFYYDVDQWEFYDLKTDPQELNNRIADPVSQEIISMLKSELKALKVYYQNDQSLEAFRQISDADFGAIQELD